MFDHVKFGGSDYAASKAFYLKARDPQNLMLHCRRCTLS